MWGISLKNNLEAMVDGKWKVIEIDTRVVKIVVANKDLVYGTDVEN